MAIYLNKMKEKGNQVNSSEQGAVLLEFALCIPLFLFLFGTMLFMFEMYNGRFMVLESNRILAWTGGDRFGVKNSDITNTVMTTGNDRSGSRSYVFKDSQTWAAQMLNPGTGGGTDFWSVNRWSGLFAGNVQVSLAESSLYTGLLMILFMDGNNKSVKEAINSTSDISYDPSSGNEDLNPSDMVVRRIMPQGYDVTINWTQCDMEKVFLFATENWHTLSDTPQEQQTASQNSKHAQAYTRICDEKLTQ